MTGCLSYLAARPPTGRAATSRRRYCAIHLWSSRPTCSPAASAEQEGWTGEVEGLDLALTFPRAKRDDTQRRIRRPAVGMTIQRLSTTSNHRKADQ